MPDDKNDNNSPGGGGHVLVAVFNTNTVLTDEVNWPTVHVFDMRDFERSEKSTHEFARPYLEDRYGMVENLRMHSTRIHTVETENDDADN